MLILLCLGFCVAARLTLPGNRHRFTHCRLRLRERKKCGDGIGRRASAARETKTANYRSVYALFSLSGEIINKSSLRDGVRQKKCGRDGSGGSGGGGRSSFFFHIFLPDGVGSSTPIALPNGRCVAAAEDGEPFCAPKRS